MWQRVFILLFCGQLAFAQSPALEIKVRDAATGNPLADAELWLPDIRQGGIADQGGRIFLNNLPAGLQQLQLSHIGYQQHRQSITLPADKTLHLTIELRFAPIQGREVLVLSTRAKKGKSPVTFSTLSREDLEVRYFAQDLPMLLSDLPSTSAYSESGNGIGYTYLNIRGFDQRRVSVLINGIPQNDPEDHNVYYIDFPDFLSNVEDIQVQRGAGNAFYGPAAIGGSINIITAGVSSERQLQASAGIGSFGTRRYSLFLNSGLLKNRFVFSGRLSRIESSGYRERSGVSFNGFFFSVAHFGKKSSTRLHFYGGPIEDQLAFSGISREAAESRETRRTNPLLRNDERERFNQPHLELLHEYNLSDRWQLNNTFFGIRGLGYFDFDGSWASPGYLRLTPEYGFDLQTDPNNFGFSSDLLIRAYVDNRQVGWLPVLMRHGERLNLTLGSELRFHRSLHWGRIQKASGDLLPQAVSGDYSGLNYIGNRRYYQYEGGKDIIAPYASANLQLSGRLTIQAALNVVYQRYLLFNESFLGTEFDYTYFFLNPRFGFTLALTPHLNAFVSIARVHREPRLSRLYEAAESSGGAAPQFESGPGDALDFDRPFAKPEKLNNLEIGISRSGECFEGSANLYYMDFQDEIIRNGKVDIFGQPRTGNAERTIHLGVELSASYRATPALSLNGNLTLAKSEIKDYTDFSTGTPVSLAGSPVIGHPDILANARVQYRRRYLLASLGLKHVGEQYTDLALQKSYNNTVAPYTSIDAILGSSLGIKNVVFQLHIQNLLNSLYITRGDGADNFFPAAERQLFMNMRVEL